MSHVNFKEVASSSAAYALKDSYDAAVLATMFSGVSASSPDHIIGSDSGTAIETLQGLTNEGAIDDIEYLKNKMMAALKIPKAFLGYEEGVGSKATLAAEDV